MSIAPASMGARNQTLPLNPALSQSNLRRVAELPDIKNPLYGRIGCYISRNLQRDFEVLLCQESPQFHEGYGQFNELREDHQGDYLDDDRHKCEYSSEDPPAGRPRE